MALATGLLSGAVSEQSIVRNTRVVDPICMYIASVGPACHARVDQGREGRLRHFGHVLEAVL
jgi:hypothetical protein